MTQKKQYAPLPKYNPFKKKPVSEMTDEECMEELKKMAASMHPDNPPTKEEILAPYSGKGAMSVGGVEIGKVSNLKMTLPPNQTFDAMLAMLKDKKPVNDFTPGAKWEWDTLKEKEENVKEYLTNSGTVTGKWSGGKPNFENIPKGTKAPVKSPFVNLTSPAGGVAVGDLLNLMGVGHVVVSEVTGAGGMNIIPILSVGDVVVLESGLYGEIIEVAFEKAGYRIADENGYTFWTGWSAIVEHTHEISFDNLKGM